MKIGKKLTLDGVKFQNYVTSNRCDYIKEIIFRETVIGFQA
jgi:hypothetical protein